MKKRTIGLRELQREATRKGRGGIQEAPVELPRLPTRDECRTGPRPCPHARCRFHLGFEISSRGALTEYLGWETRGSCALDVAESGPHDRVSVARMYGGVGEMLAVCERAALRQLGEILKARGVSLADAWRFLVARPQRAGFTPEERLTMEEIEEFCEAADRVLQVKSGKDHPWRKSLTLQLR